MNKQHVRIQYKELAIRPLTPADLELRVQWFNDPDIRETLILNKPLELDKTIEWFEKTKESEERIDFVIESSGQAAIGAAGLRQIDYREKSAGIYMVLGNKAYWGKGIMYDVHLALLDYVFKRLELKRIWANVLSNNIASYVTLKKVGFSREAVLEKEFIRDGKSYDVYRIAISSGDFYRKHPEFKLS